jgi:hypothetical protein
MGWGVSVTPSLILLAGVALAVWGAWFGAIVVATRPRADDQAGAGGTGTDEPPAVAALLCAATGVLPERAVTATYLDLLARGFLRRTEAARGQGRIEPAAAAKPGMRPHERHVFDHVAARAEIGGGSVPEDALHLESSEHAKAWMTTFTDQVVADARGRGLVMERISLGAVFWLWVGLAMPAGLALAAGASVWLCLLAYVALAWSALVLHRPLPTSAGRRAAAKYRVLGAQLRTEVDAHEGESLSASRTGAYAVALGVGGPARSPFAPRFDQTVWSNASGTWRQVRIIDAPGFLRGIDPVATLYSIPGGLLLFVIWGYLLFWFTTDPPRAWKTPDALLIAGGLVWTCFGFVFWRFVYHGLYDLCHDPIAVAGRVVYLEAGDPPGSEEPSKRYLVAIDDGHTDVAVKYEIDADLFATLRYGARLRLDVTPKLRHAKAIQVSSHERAESRQ